MLGALGLAQELLPGAASSSFDVIYTHSGHPWLCVVPDCTRGGGEVEEEEPAPSPCTPGEVGGEEGEPAPLPCPPGEEGDPDLELVRPVASGGGEVLGRLLHY